MRFSEALAWALTQITREGGAVVNGVIYRDIGHYWRGKPIWGGL